jgi:hypothetical protein
MTPDELTGPPTKLFLPYRTSLDRRPPEREHRSRWFHMPPPKIGMSESLLPYDTYGSHQYCEDRAMAKTQPPSRARIGIEVGVAFFAGVLGVVTIFWHDWIEALTGWDPDHHSGSIEWLIVAVLLVVCAGLGALAQRDRRVRTVMAHPG